MDESPAYHVDINGVDDTASDGARVATLHGRPWVGVHFECCHVYARIYRNAKATGYEGFCPRCRRKLSLRVGPEGTDARFFKAE